MLWHPSYETIILRDVSLPLGEDGFSLDGSALEWPLLGIVLGSFSLSDRRDLGVWSRLVAQEFPDQAYRTVFIQGEWSARARKDVAASIPTSQRGRTFTISDPLSVWAYVVPSKRSFAAIVQGPVMPLVMIGPATEEAWDIFRGTFETVQSQSN